MALAFTWPLPLQLGTHLTGSPGGDTGVYVWNQWVFQHELLDNRGLPYFTDRIFSLGRPANLGLHNYTTFQNLLALPLVGTLGVVTTFNVVYLLTTVLTAYMVFLLARQVTGRAAESWLAGLAFAWSPILVTRGMAHFSVAAAAPLAGFLLVLLRAAERERLRDALLLGVAVWWATSTDVYYGVYCLVIAALFLGARTITLVPVAPRGRRAVPWALDVLLLCVGGLVVAMVISGGWQFTFLGRIARVRSMYTPMLVLTVLGVLRLAWGCCRPRLAALDRAHTWRLVRLTAVTGIVAAVLLSPTLYAVGQRIAQSGLEGQRTFWRSSPRGIDLVALVLPNPNHPMAPRAIHDWLAARPDGFVENTASVPFVVVGVLAFALWRGWRASRAWTGFGVFFGLLALGPFLHVAGVNTYVPGPWALLRYVPLLGMARTPARFSVVLMLTLSVLLAAALCWLVARAPHRRKWLLSAVGALLVVELLPAPRVLHSAAIPSIYRHVADSPRDARVLELPFGVRDGTSSYGNFTALSQFFQTYHQKPLIGGYLSRVSRRRIAEIRQFEMLAALMTLSEGTRLDAAREARLAAEAPAFAARSRIEWVVIDHQRTPAVLRGFAQRAFQLDFVERDGDLELFRVR